MGLSGQDRNQLVDALLSDELTAALREEAAAGTLDPGSIHRRLSALLNESPAIQALDPNDQRAVLGMTNGRIKKLIPQAPKQVGPGEQVLALDGEALLAWRRELTKRMATPVAFVYEQARHGLELEAGHPRRRDLAWDIVNAAVTAVRYSCVVALADYLDGGLTDPQLNRALFETIRKPADGSWSSLLWSPDAGADHSLLHVLDARETRVETLSCLRGSLSKSDVPGKETFGQIKGLPGKVPGSVKELGDAFVSFRNELVHGVYSRQRPSDEVLDRLGRVLDVLLAVLEPVTTLPLVVPRSDGLELANGPTLGVLDDVEGVLGKATPADEDVDRPLVVAGPRLLAVSPWVIVADLTSAIQAAEDDQHSDDDPQVALAEVCFFNRFEADLVHYLGFAARAQLPHTELIETELAETAYQRFSEQMELLRLQSAPAAARKADPIQRFDALADFHGENFVGRADIIGNVEAFIADRPAPMGVITAAPGMGKSAMLTHFYRAHGTRESTDGWLFHFSARADQRDNAVLGLRSLIAQAEVQLQRNLDAPAKKPPLPWSYEDLSTRFEETLVELAACMAAKGRRAVLVLDALDEQVPRPGAPPESIFGAVPDECPDNLVILVSVRIDNDGNPVAIDPGAIAMPRATEIPKAAPLSGLTRDDVATLIREKLAAEKPELLDAPQAVLDRVAEAAQRPEDGTLDPFYLRFLAEGVRDGSIDLSEAGNVPTGLESFFDDLWWSLDTSNDFLLHRMLGMLSEMEGFGDDALFAEALKKPTEDVARLRFGINKLLVKSGSVGEPRYGLFHDRFRWYVQSRYRQRDKARALHLPLLDACRAGISAADNYAVRYTTYHLAVLSDHPGLTTEEQTNYRNELWDTVHSDRFIEQKFSALGDERAVIVDFTRAFEVFRPKATDDEADQLRKAGQITWLADRCARTVAQVANLARARLHDYAREGDAVRVIQLSERAGSDALRWMTLLRAARTMRDENLDPNPLFEAIQATHSPELAWTDRPMLERLLTDADAPESIAHWILEQIPEVIAELDLPDDEDDLELLL